jgi:hypothetical protein
VTDPRSLSVRAILIIPAGSRAAAAGIPCLTKSNHDGPLNVAAYAADAATAGGSPLFIRAADARPGFCSSTT